ncbi:MAG: hypothetical protein WKF77_12780 [Planctomycetaceae bacterium]
MKTLLLSAVVAVCLVTNLDACDKCKKSRIATAGTASVAAASVVPDGEYYYTYMPAVSYAPAASYYAPAAGYYSPATSYYAPAASYVPAGSYYSSAAYGYAPAGYGSNYVPAGWFQNAFGLLDTGVGVVRDNACPACRALGCCNTSGGGSDPGVDATTSLITRVKDDLSQLKALKKELDEFGDLFNKKAESPAPEPAPGASADFSSEPEMHLARLDRIRTGVEKSLDRKYLENVAIITRNDNQPK